MANLNLKQRYGGAALVTGASSGIGEAFARALAAEGLDLVVVARRRDRLETLAAELAKRHGVRAHVVAADLAERDAAARVIREVDAAGIEIGILLSNAGFGTYGLFLDQDPETQLRIVEVNNRAMVALASAVAPRLAARGRGAIVFLASTAAYQPVAFEAVYGASKAFNLMFGEALWAELRPKGVDVVVLSPGFTPTEYQQKAAMGTPKPITGWTSAERVAAEALATLGKAPSVVPGWRNRVVVRLMRIITRAAAARLTYRANNPKGGHRR